MLTTERLKQDLAEIEAHIAALTRQVQIVHGAKSALDKLIGESEADDADRKAAEEEAARQQADIEDAEMNALADEAICTDPDCPICNRSAPVPDDLLAERGRVDPGEIAVAMKE